MGVFGSNGTPTNYNSPIYLFIDFGNSSNVTPSMYGQVWMGQVTDTLVLSGGSQELQINASNIRSVVGSNVGSVLFSEDFNSWTPTAIPEPSYAWVAGFIFLGAVLYKKYV
jgi:hypothetical protein